MSAISQRDQALSILESDLLKLSNIYKDCYRSMGRGAMLVYASEVVERRLPNEMSYRTKKEILEVFDAPSSQEELKQLITKYDPETQGIMTLITSYSNATFFVTFNLK